MNIQGKHYQTIWIKPYDNTVIQVIDQRKLPFMIEVFELQSTEDTFYALREMVVRGAPLIGITAAYGMYLALLRFKKGDLLSYISDKAVYLKSARPTAVNLAFAVDEMVRFISLHIKEKDLPEKALAMVESMKNREIAFSKKIGEFGAGIIDKIYRRKNSTVNILTHCNAGWLACIDWGTATAPVYVAHQNGIPLHVWVDETRPRNQGARLTAFELSEEGVAHTVISDNTGGHLMQHGKVDLVLVGSDRTTATGDVANKIGTYLKALAAFDNNIPFYVALPSSSIDWKINDGLTEIPIEERAGNEVAEIEGWNGREIVRINLIPSGTNTANYGFDVTPARLITALITERGICKADKKAITELFSK